MCGITGIIDFNKQSSKEDFRAMTHTWNIAGQMVRHRVVQ